MLLTFAQPHEALPETPRFGFEWQFLCESQYHRFERCRAFQNLGYTRLGQTVPDPACWWGTLFGGGFHASEPPPFP